MQKNRRNAGVAVALLAVVTIAVAGWFWVRPWWQERSLTQALRDTPGVASVDRTERNAAPYDLKFDITFTEDVTARQLRAAMERVDREVAEHEVSGDRAGVEMRIGDFVLEPSAEGALSPGVLGAVLALRDVEGLTGVEVDDYEVTTSTSDNEALAPVAIRALEAVAAAKVDVPRDAALRLVSRRGNGQLRATLSEAASQADLLEGLDRAVTLSGAKVPAVESPGLSISTFARPGQAAECDAQLAVESESQLRDVARVVAREALRCGVTLATGEPDSQFSLRLQPGNADPAQALALREQLERIGITSTQVNSDLGFIGMIVEDADGLDALRRLTRDPSRWPAPANASLTVRWAGTSWNALEHKPVSVLQRLGAAMADVRRAGFVASSADQTGPKNQLTVTDDVKGARELTTPEGRQAAVRAIRGSGFPGSVQFRIASNRRGALAFTSTADGKATNVRYPEDGPNTSWSRDFIDDWNQSAG